MIYFLAACTCVNGIKDKCLAINLDHKPVCHLLLLHANDTRRHNMKLLLQIVWQIPNDYENEEICISNNWILWMNFILLFNDCKGECCPFYTKTDLVQSQDAK